jgi:hypothetical protein
MSERNLRVYRGDDRFFRVDVANPSAPAEMLGERGWAPLVPTAQEVSGLLKVRELTPDEIDGLDLPS